MNKNIQLHNEHLIAHVNYHGAELSRLYSKQFDREILWNGDATYWGRHAPVLFPFVGKLKNGEYEHEGSTYNLGQHGFARDQEFSLIEKSDSHCVLELVASENTKQLYPFDFSFRTTFTLTNNGLKTSYTVKNTDNSTLLFSLGAHPAFNCPMENNKLEDYQLIFQQKETAQTLLLDSSGLLSDQKSAFLNNQDTIKLNDDLFEKDALMFTNLKSNALTINAEKDELSVKVSWENFPYLGIWKPLGAPFLCIEPWYGIADFNNASGKLSEKFGIISLEKGNTFNANYVVTIK